MNAAGINRNSQEAAENDGVEQFEEDEDFTTLWREELLDSDSNAGQLREKRPASVDQRLWRTHDRLDVKFFHRTTRDFLVNITFGEGIIQKCTVTDAEIFSFGCEVRAL
jgi:hypothetical protein